MRTLVVLALTSLAFAPPNGLHPEGRDISPRYTADVHQAFAEAFAPDVVLRALVEPSFRPERAAILRKTGAGWRLVTLEAREQIWELEERRLRERSLAAAGDGRTQVEADRRARRSARSLADIAPTRCERAVSTAFSQALTAAWMRQVRDARPETREEQTVVTTDGDTYKFAVRTASGMPEVEARSPPAEHASGRLAALADRLGSFCRTGDAAEGAALAREAAALG